MSDEKEDQRSPLKEVVQTCQELFGEDIFFTEKRKTPQLYPGLKNISSRKMKLQLFPINRSTQIALEKVR